MSSSLFHRRRAERLAQLLDEANGRPKHHTRSTLDGELAGYVRLSDELARTANVNSSPCTEFRTELRAMLVATADRGNGYGDRTEDGQGDDHQGQQPSSSTHDRSPRVGRGLRSATHTRARPRRRHAGPPRSASRR